MAITLKKKANYSWLTRKLIENVDLNSYATDAVMTKLKKELKLSSEKSLKRITYFFTYKKVNDRKGVHNLYVRRSMTQPFLKITSKEMLEAGAVPYEFKVFLEGIKAKEFKVTPDFFEKL